MPTTSPIEMGKGTDNMKDGGDTMEHYADELSSETGSSGLETSDAKRAKTQALALSQAAESARARYARLTSPQGRRNNPDLQHSMMADDTSDLVAEQGKQIESTQTALAATLVAGQLSSFQLVKDNPLLKAAVPAAPVLFLKPTNRESGVAGFVADPRVWSLVAVAALATASDVMEKKRKKEAIAAEEKKRKEAIAAEEEKGKKEIVEVRISRFRRRLSVGQRDKFLADAFDRSGKRVPGARIIFNSGRPEIAATDEAGNVTALKEGTTEITATFDGRSDLVAIRVNAIPDEKLAK